MLPTTANIFLYLTFYHTSYRLTAIMTSRFILDLHEAADPRFDGLSTDGGISTLIFPATCKHAPRVDRDVTSSSSAAGTGWIEQNSEIGSMEVGECDDAEWEVSISPKITAPCWLLTSLRSFGTTATWCRVQTDVSLRRRDAKMSSPSSGYDDERPGRAGAFQCHAHPVYIWWCRNPKIDPNKRVAVSSGLTAVPDGARLLKCAPSTFHRRVHTQHPVSKRRRPWSLACNTATHNSTGPLHTPTERPAQSTGGGRMTRSLADRPAARLR